MRILHIYDEAHPEDVVPLNRGIYAVIFNLSKQSMEKGHDVTVLIRRDEDEVAYISDVRTIQFKSKNIADLPIREIKKHFPFKLILDYVNSGAKVRKILKGDSFDVIHVHFPLTSSILVTVNRTLRKKMVYTAHIGEEAKRFNFNGKAPLPLKLFSPDLYLIKRVRKAIVLNENLKDRLVREKGVEEDRIMVIANGINVEEYRDVVVDEEFKKKYRIKEPSVLFVGTITPRKGVIHLARAADILKKEGYKMNFIFAGDTQVDPRYSETVNEFVRSNELDVNITEFVPYNDLKALYSACDIFVLPSFEEGHGIVVTEAMASGKPLIGSRVGGIPAQIRDGWNGFLVEPGNEKDLAEKIGYLIENEEERERMGKNSRKLAEKEFDWSKIAERYLKVYEEIAGQIRRNNTKKNRQT